MKINKGFVESAVIASVVAVSAFLMLKSSDEPLIEFARSVGGSGLFRQFPSGNQLIFDLSAGLLVSLLFYLVVVRIPEAKSRRRAKSHLAWTYEKFKEDVIQMLIAALGRPYASDFPQRLLDKHAFREFFKEENRWGVAFNNFEEYELRQLRDSFEILIEELRFTFLAIDVDDDGGFRSLKLLQHFVHRMKGRTLDYDEKKEIFRFLWSTCTGFSFVHGYREPDAIENLIASV